MFDDLADDSSAPVGAASHQGSVHVKQEGASGGGGGGGGGALPRHGAGPMRREDVGPGGGGHAAWVDPELRRIMIRFPEVRLPRMG